MNIAFGIDAGSKLSAFIGWNGKTTNSGKVYDNDHLLTLIRDTPLEGVRVGIEQVRGMGMIAGNELFDTCFFTGVLYEALSQVGANAILVPRKTVITYHTGKPQGGDAELKAAIRAKHGNVLHGVLAKEASHLYAALGVADYVLSL